jgi:ribonuclease inhibitor
MYADQEIQFVILDGAQMATKEAAHAHLKEQFDFPDYYGNNLDALWDLLSSWSDPLAVRLINSEVLYQSLGPYGVQLISVFTDALQENSKIRFEISHESDFFENVIL